LPADGGHPAAVDPAGDDPLERLQVVVDVDREAVRGHSPADVHADRADLATLRWPTADPDAGKTIDHLRLDAAGGERIDHQPLQPVDVVVDVVAVRLQGDDRVPDPRSGGGGGE